MWLALRLAQDFQASCRLVVVPLRFFLAAVFSGWRKIAGAYEAKSCLFMRGQAWVASRRHLFRYITQAQLPLAISQKRLFAPMPPLCRILRIFAKAAFLSLKPPRIRAISGDACERTRMHASGRACEETASVSQFAREGTARFRRWSAGVPPYPPPCNPADLYEDPSTS